jgi:hypothetical protein
VIKHPLRQCWNVGFRSPDDARAGVESKARAITHERRRRVGLEEGMREMGMVGLVGRGSMVEG